MLEMIGVRGATPGTIEAVMRTADPNGDGTLNYKELLSALRPQPRRGSKPAAQAQEVRPAKNTPPMNPQNLSNPQPSEKRPSSSSSSSSESDSDENEDLGALASDPRVAALRQQTLLHRKSEKLMSRQVRVFFQTFWEVLCLFLRSLIGLLAASRVAKGRRVRPSS